jgi:hypothetical protein
MRQVANPDPEIRPNGSVTGRFLPSARPDLRIRIRRRMRLQCKQITSSPIYPSDCPGVAKIIYCFAFLEGFFCRFVSFLSAGVKFRFSVQCSVNLALELYVSPFKSGYLIYYSVCIKHANVLSDSKFRCS